ncbi:MAG: hypothetical protein GKR89_34920 [Candidatus Latescibacteria bacterium]|nr:hypothetical protein [Candidatus Latescibacterota bacterium]
MRHSQALAVDIDADGHFYIADRFNFRVRRVDGETGIISTVAGSGAEGFLDDGIAPECSFSIIRDVLLDQRGGLYIADGGNSRIARLALDTGRIEIVAGRGGDGFSGDGGPATAALLNKPYSIALDPGHNLYIFDDDNARLRRVDAQTGIITTVAGTGVRGFSGDGGPAMAATMMSANT